MAVKLPSIEQQKVQESSASKEGDPTHPPKYLFLFAIVIAFKPYKQSNVKLLTNWLNLLQSLEYLVDSTLMLDNRFYLTMSEVTMVKKVTMLHDLGFPWPEVAMTQTNT